MSSAFTHPLHITDLEAAINWWRSRKPSPDGVMLPPELRALAEVYALMVYRHVSDWESRRYLASS